MAVRECSRSSHEAALRLRCVQQQLERQTPRGMVSFLRDLGCMMNPGARDRCEGHKKHLAPTRYRTIEAPRSRTHMAARRSPIGQTDRAKSQKRGQRGMVKHSATQGSICMDREQTRQIAVSGVQSRSRVTTPNSGSSSRRGTTVQEETRMEMVC